MNLYRECKIERQITVNSLYTAFETAFDGTYSFAGETHDFWEMVYIKKGTVGVVADDNVYNLSKGQLILHPPMQFHRIWSEGNENPAVIVISFGAEWKAYPENCIFMLDNEQEKYLDLILEEIKETFVMEKRIVSVCRQGREIKAQSAVNRLELLLLSVSASDSFVCGKTAPNNKKYTEIVKILSDNLDKNLSLADIAEMCNMSVSNLKKIFYKYSGMGMKRYYNEMKARQAAQYLRDGLSVKETGALLGFADQNYFSVFFKRMMGKSPVNYIK